MNLEKFISETFEEKNGYCYRPRIVCNDGFDMSVQGSVGHYCNPRKTQDWYNEMEIGFPNQEEELIMQYAEQENDPCGTVYGYVPCDIIQKVIEKHGGIDIEATFKRSNEADA
jgi:hypothetical protein